MRKYKAVEMLGEGSFACVHKCSVINPKTDTEHFVAVKHMKQHFKCWEECKRLREVQALTKLKHKNIIQCTEVVLEHNHQLYLVFEYAPKNLWQVITDKTEILNVDRTCRLLAQLLDGLAYMHKHGIFHRDIKPENLLLIQAPTGNKEILKIADFGCMREIRSRPPFTNYVATRWYRAPELLIRSTIYSSPVDVWAAGVILGEMFLRTNLFPGNTDIDTLHHIYAMMGAPPQEILRSQSSRNINIPNYPSVPLHKVFAGTELEKDGTGQNLFSMMLHADPSKRPTAKQARTHLFFSDHHQERNPTHHHAKQQQSESKAAVSSKSAEQKINLLRQQSRRCSKEEDVHRILSQMTFETDSDSDNADIEDFSLVVNESKGNSDDEFEDFLDKVAPVESKSGGFAKAEAKPSPKKDYNRRKSVDTDELDSLLDEIIDK